MRDLTAIQTIFSCPPASLVFGAPEVYDDEGESVPRLIGKRLGVALDLLGAPAVRLASLGVATVVRPQAGLDMALGALLLAVLCPDDWHGYAVWYGAMLGRMGAAPAVGFRADIAGRRVRFTYAPEKRYLVLQVGDDS